MASRTSTPLGVIVFATAFPLSRHVATERLARRLYELGREDTPEQLGDHLHHQCELAFNKMIAAGVPADVAQEQAKSLFFAMTDDR